MKESFALILLWGHCI
uniref:Uncharacterized protein n=1 Tax=Anguilla anguilla TaxID=7936 RepID=A0A0E9QQY9_ANGAN